MYRYVHVQVRLCTGAFMYRYVHVLVHSCTAQVGSCTELFMYRYVHVQVSSCTGNIIKCPPLIFKCNYITCVCKGIRVYMYTPSFDDIWNCSTPRLEFSIDFPVKNKTRKKRVYFISHQIVSIHLGFRSNKTELFCTISKLLYLSLTFLFIPSHKKLKVVVTRWIGGRTHACNIPTGVGPWWLCLVWVFMHRSEPLCTLQIAVDF